MWHKLDRLDPAVAAGAGAALGAAVWWAVATAAPAVAVWAGLALLAAAAALALSARRPVAAPEPAVAAGVGTAAGASAVTGVSDTPAGPPAAAQPPLPPGIDALEPYRFAVVSVGERGQVRERREAEALSFAEDLGGGVQLDMTYIPGGHFLMGSPEGEAERFSDEGPQHEVTVGPFYLGRHAVTQAQWRVVAGWPKAERELKPEPSRFKGDDRPVEQVSWHDAVEFCRRLSGRTGRVYALPSEAQWEYACRAGTTTPFHFGPTITPELVNYHGNYPYGAAPKGEDRQQTTPAGSFGVANEFGLFDVHGNVWEWCQDIWHENYRGAPADGKPWEPQGWLAKLLRRGARQRVLRGGSWLYNARYCRAAYRLRVNPENRRNLWGFRVVCSVSRTQMPGAL